MRTMSKQPQFDRHNLFGRQFEWISLRKSLHFERPKNERHFKCSRFCILIILTIGKTSAKFCPC